MALIRRGERTPVPIPMIVTIGRGRIVVIGVVEVTEEVVVAEEAEVIGMVGEVTPRGRPRVALVGVGIVPSPDMRLPIVGTLVAYVVRKTIRCPIALGTPCLPSIGVHSHLFPLPRILLGQTMPRRRMISRMRILLWPTLLLVLFPSPRGKNHLLDPLLASVGKVLWLPQPIYLSP
jgi:hypothetical protein